MYLFIYRGWKKRRDMTSDELVLKCLREYADCTEDDSIEHVNVRIERTKAGKPFFFGTDVQFSVSHTGAVWVCLMGRGALGVDIQRKAAADVKGIAKRFFGRNERELTVRQGEDAFLRIWTRKEACAKFAGSSLAEVLGSCDLVKDGMVVDSTVIDGSTICFQETAVEDDAVCVCASERKEKIWTRNLNQEHI